MKYETYIHSIKVLEKHVDNCEANLKRVAGDEKGPMGLTPDHIKFSKEYQQAKRAFDIAFDGVRRLNKITPKAYFKQRQKERRSNWKTV